jgi:hypothetical protein
MNKLKALKYIARKEQYELQDLAILNYNIDGIWLDEALEQKYPNEGINELVPSLLYRFDDDKVIKFISDTIFPKSNQTSICPILTCNQGCGLDCPNIVAEIENNGNQIIWKRFGLKVLDKSIQWLDIFSNLEFTYEEYNTLLNNFKTIRKKV